MFRIRKYCFLIQMRGRVLPGHFVAIEKNLSKVNMEWILKCFNALNIFAKISLKLLWKINDPDPEPDPHRHQIQAFKYIFALFFQNSIFSIPKNYNREAKFTIRRSSNRRLSTTLGGNKSIFKSQVSGKKASFGFRSHPDSKKSNKNTDPDQWL